MYFSLYWILSQNVDDVFAGSHITSYCGVYDPSFIHDSKNMLSFFFVFVCKSHDTKFSNVAYSSVSGRERLCELLDYICCKMCCLEEKTYVFFAGSHKLIFGNLRQSSSHYTSHDVSDVLIYKHLAS